MGMTKRPTAAMRALQEQADQLTNSIDILQRKIDDIATHREAVQNIRNKLLREIERLQAERTK